MREESSTFVLVSYYCCNKLLQIQWLKTIQIYYLLVWGLEVRNQFTGVNQIARRAGSSASNRENPCFAAFTSRGCQDPLALGHVTQISASEATSPPPLCQISIYLPPVGTLVVTFRAYTDSPGNSPSQLNHICKFPLATKYNVLRFGGLGHRYLGGTIVELITKRKRKYK